MAGIRVNVTWRGLDDMIAHFQAYAKAVPVRVSSAYNEVGDQSKDVMDSYTPVLTGRLKRNNAVGHQQYGFRLSNAVEYSIYVEYGTRYMAAQPYLSPATEFARAELHRRLPQALKY